MEDIRRRVQQQTLGHRGRRHDPLYRIPRCATAPGSTAHQLQRIEPALAAGDPRWEVTIAWWAYRQLRLVCAAKDLATGERIALQVLESFHNCPVPEFIRLGHTLLARREQVLAYFTTGGANNGGTKALNGTIELARRIARGFRIPANYHLRMILAAGRLSHPDLR